MSTQADNDDDDQEHIRPRYHITVLRSVELHECVPTRLGTAGDNIAMLTLRSRGRLEKPMCLSLDDARRLAIALLRVLSFHGSSLATQVLRQFFHRDRWPTRDLRGRIRPEPSIGENIPPEPITDRDVWMLTMLLRHVEDHETFMRFIDVPNRLIRQAPRRRKSRKKAAPKPKRRKRG